MIDDRNDKYRQLALKMYEHSSEADIREDWIFEKVESFKNDEGKFKEMSEFFEAEQ